MKKETIPAYADKSHRLVGARSIPLGTP